MHREEYDGDVLVGLLPLDLLWKAVAANALFWIFMLIPFGLDSIVYRKKFVIVFAAGLGLATIGFYENPSFLLVLPGLYSIIAAPLLQAAMMKKVME